MKIYMIFIAITIFSKSLKIQTPVDDKKSEPYLKSLQIS